MASAVPSQGWLENDENVVMRVNLCCEGGPCRWTHQPGERPPLALQGRVSQEMWTEFLTECKRDLAKYDKHKLAWISVPLIWLALLATNLDFVSAFSAVVATMNNLGPGLGEVAKHYGAVSEPGKLTLCLAMLMGRLEVFTLLVLLTPAFWRH